MNSTGTVHTCRPVRAVRPVAARSVRRSALLVAFWCALVAQFLVWSTPTAWSEPAVADATTSPATAPSAPPSAADRKNQVSWATVPANTAVGRERAYYTYSLAPGGTVTDALAVVNRSDKPIKLRLYASDAFTTAAGGIDVLAADKQPVDVGSWITLKTTTITLASQQSATVPFTLRVPATATPGDHSGAVITSLITSQTGQAVQLDRRLGSRVYLRVTGPVTPSLRVSDVQAVYRGTANPGGSGTTTVTYRVSNIGNVRLAAQQRVTVTGIFGTLQRSAPATDLAELLPGNSVTRSALVSGVWPGIRLSAAVELQPFSPTDPTLRAAPAGSGDVAWAWPIGQLGVLILLAALVQLARWRRRQRRRAVDSAIQAAVSQALGPEAPANSTTGTTRPDA
jgi:hypothetical protein